jgi:catechol 2,3-dioxygenase-like lactoylglutathione lyase family enzyme
MCAQLTCPQADFERRIGVGLSQNRVVSAIAVSDMERAKQFYEGALGLTPADERPDGGTRYPCGGDTAIHVYPSPDNAGSSTATLAGFEVDDIEAAVDELSANGVAFEQYDVGQIKTDERGIAPLGDAKGAWFKDPDGNIISLIQE